MTGLKYIINKIKENINYFQYEKMKNQITLFFFFLLFMVVIFIDLATAKIDFVVGDVSNRDIVAPKTISYIDEVKTTELKNEMLSTVVDVYDFDINILPRTISKLDGLFNLLAESKVVTSEDLLSADSETRLKNFLKENQLFLSENSRKVLLAENDNDKSFIYLNSKLLLENYLQRGISDKDLELNKKYLLKDINELNAEVEIKLIIADICSNLLKNNLVINQKETNDRRNKAIETVEPVRKNIIKGQVVVRRGEIVTDEQLYAIKELGLYENNIDKSKFLGTAIFMLFSMLILDGYLRKFKYKIYDDNNKMILLWLIILFSLLMAKFGHYYNCFITPITAGALLIAILITPRIALMSSIVVAFLVGMGIEYDSRVIAFVLLSSLIGVYTVVRTSHGYSLLKTGLIISIANVIVIASTGLIAQINYQELMLEMLLGALSGVLSAVITTGILPYFEYSFKITTPLTLIELGQSNHPLLQRLLLEAPGTYHHSVIIGNLAEAAANEIGLDAILVRVGAYYHDVGKIRRAGFFVENQFGSANPHDKLTPGISTLILTSHVKDGVALCKEYKIPQDIIDIVEQHHGNSYASFFYAKAISLYGENNVNKDDYRYPGPKPQTKEAAIIMIADSCEAAVRSLSNHGNNKIDNMVHKIINQKLNDGQFDECDISMKELMVVATVYIKILSSMFHSRIEYPENIVETEAR